MKRLLPTASLSPCMPQVVPDEKGQVQIVQARVSQSGQFFAVAAIPQTIVKTIQLLAMGNERAENVIPAILSFFFHGIGFLFQGRFLKFIFTVAVSSMIWYAPRLATFVFPRVFFVTFHKVRFLRPACRWYHRRRVHERLDGHERRQRWHQEYHDGSEGLCHSRSPKTQVCTCILPLLLFCF